MIRVKKSPETREVVCPNCKSKLEYESSDVQKANSGDPFIMCPLCNLHVWLDEEEKIITPENLIYPADFYRFGGADSKKVSQDETEKWCKETLQKLEENPSDPFYTISSGDTIVIGLRCEQEIEIYVAHVYENCTVFHDDKEAK